MIFYFSGTGNSKWIANQLSKEQKEELVFIPDALNNGTFEFCLREDEKIGFVFPVYSWAPPEIVLSRPLKSTHLRDIARKQCPADFFNK